MIDLSCLFIALLARGLVLSYVLSIHAIISRTEAKENRTAPGEVSTAH